MILSLKKTGSKLIVSEVGENLPWADEIKSPYSLDVKINYDEASLGNPIESVKINGIERLTSPVKAENIETVFLDELDGDGNPNALITNDLEKLKVRLLKF